MKLLIKALLLNNVINKCPEIIFAVNRIQRVIGRIKLLIVSIITINGIKIIGVPWGIIWENIKLVFLIHINIIKPNHNGKDTEIE